MTDRDFMEIALSLARERKGLTHPNPTVGCVVVKEGRIVATGNHIGAGYPHAEVVALDKAGEEARGSTLYITLEPCTHWGRTPPCTEAIIRSGVRRVVIATTDPNPIISGSGIQKLRDAGIEVEVGVLEEEAKRINEDFFKYITSDRPYVTLKLAQTIDGKIATPSGDSKWITSREARTIAHRLRHEATAVLVGVNTVLRDDPLLTVRHVPAQRNPMRVIIDPELETPLNAKIIEDESAKTFIYFREGEPAKVRALTDRGIFLIEMVDFSLRNILRDLKEREILHLLVEGGAYTVTQFLKEGLWDRLVIFLAPKILGSGISIGDLGIKSVKDAINLELREEIRLGSERVLEYVPVVRRRGLRW